MRYGLADLQRPHRNVRVEKLPGRSNDRRASIVYEHGAASAYLEQGAGGPPHGEAP